MVSIINTKNEIEFELSLRRSFIYSPSSKISSISLYDSKIDDSLETKLFISDIYYDYYKAKISVNYPTLMTILDKNNNVLAAVGFRLAQREDLSR